MLQRGLPGGSLLRSSAAYIANTLAARTRGVCWGGRSVHDVERLATRHDEALLVGAWPCRVRAFGVECANVVADVFVTTHRRQIAGERCRLVLEARVVSLATRCLRSSTAAARASAAAHRRSGTFAIGASSVHREHRVRRPCCHVRTHGSASQRGSSAPPPRFAPLDANTVSGQREAPSPKEAGIPAVICNTRSTVPPRTKDALRIVMVR